VLMEHKLDLSGFSVRQLRARRRRLAASFGDVEDLVAGRLIRQERRCGKPGCRCVQGPGHGPYTYLQVAGVAGRSTLALRGGEQVQDPLIGSRRVAYTASGAWSTNRSLCSTSSTAACSVSVRARGCRFLGAGAGAGPRGTGRAGWAR
jgi:hypothetical protein